ncbi:MAG: hypothetical protein IV094_04595 [Vitreoscilla sp.]|nr:hypothetical protein [Vitreoscilla sp.]
MLDAGSGDDTLDGGVGYDQLWGGSGSDTYLMRSNYGIDKISEWEDEGGPSNDVVDFGPTLRMADATYFHVGDDLEVHIANSNPNKIDRVVIVDWYWDRSQQVESFVFSDGTLTAAQVEALADGPHLAAVEHESTRFNRCDEDGYRWPRRDRSIGDPGRDRLDWRPSLVAGQLVQAMSTFKMLGEPMGIRLQHLAVGIHQVPFTIPQAFL